ncbi:MAG: hypothetical protein ACO3EK_13235, partial [Alphaproteobacteria bacterium]
MTGVFKDPRKRAYLNPEGADRPLRSPVPRSTLLAARAWRKRRLVEQVPFEAPRLRPFAPRRELLPHEQQLLAGVAPHEGVIGAQGRE